MNNITYRGKPYDIEYVSGDKVRVNDRHETTANVSVGTVYTLDKTIDLLGKTWSVKEGGYIHIHKVQPVYTQAFFDKLIKIKLEQKNKCEDEALEFKAKKAFMTKHGLDEYDIEVEKSLHLIEMLSDVSISPIDRAIKLKEILQYNF